MLGYSHTRLMACGAADAAAKRENKTTANFILYSGQEETSKLG